MYLNEVHFKNSNCVVVSNNEMCMLLFVQFNDEQQMHLTFIWDNLFCLGSLEQHHTWMTLPFEIFEGNNVLCDSMWSVAKHHLSA